MIVLRVMALSALVLAACSAPASRAPAADGGARDFRIMAYQGEDVLGAGESTFGRVFAQGKPVVLNFWAGLCPPCRAEMPAFQKVADEFQGRAIFVGVDVGPFVGLGSRDDARRLLADLGVHYPTAAAVDESPLRLYSVRNMPTTVFFSADGQVVERVGGMLLEPQLRGTLQKLVTPSEAR